MFVLHQKIREAFIKCVKVWIRSNELSCLDRLPTKDKKKHVHPNYLIFWWTFFLFPLLYMKIDNWFEKWGLCKICKICVKSCPSCKAQQGYHCQCKFWYSAILLPSRDMCFIAALDACRHFLRMIQIMICFFFCRRSHWNNLSLFFAIVSYWYPCTLLTYLNLRKEAVKHFSSFNKFSKKDVMVTWFNPNKNF